MLRVMALADWKAMKTNSGFLKDNNRFGPIVLRNVLKQSSQALPNGLQMGIAESDQDNANLSRGQIQKKVWKIQVHGYHNAPFQLGFLEDRCIGCLRQAEVSSMDRIVLEGTQPLDGALGHRHIEEKFHPELGGSGEREDGFTGQPGSVFNCFLDVFWFQVRIVLKNPLLGFTCSQQVEDQVDRDPKAPDASLSPQFVRINGDSREAPFHCTPKYTMVPVRPSRILRIGILWDPRGFLLGLHPNPGSSALADFICLIRGIVTGGTLPC